jgi:UvrD-like helicase C-terminal domain
MTTRPLRRVTYGFGEFDAFVPTYAAIIHKSQGSEYPAVVIPVMTQHYTMLQRNLLYTGVTRAKRLVVLVGQKKAVAIGCAQRLGPSPLVQAERMADGFIGRCGCRSSVEMTSGRVALRAWL